MRILIFLSFIFLDAGEVSASWVRLYTPAGSLTYIIGKKHLFIREQPDGMGIDFGKPAGISRELLLLAANDDITVQTERAEIARFKGGTEIRGIDVRRISILLKNKDRLNLYGIAKSFWQLKKKIRPWDFSDAGFNAHYLELSKLSNIDKLNYLLFNKDNGHRLSLCQFKNIIMTFKDKYRYIAVRRLFHLLNQEDIQSNIELLNILINKKKYELHKI